MAIDWPAGRLFAEVGLPQEQVSTGCKFVFPEPGAPNALLLARSVVLDIQSCPRPTPWASTERHAAMRNYPCNSPEAAARLVALVLIADGHVSRSEVDTLDLLGAAHDLGLEPDGMPRIVQTLCEDLLLGADASGSLFANIDESALASLMAEVTDPSLRAKVVHLATAVAHADRHLSDGEALVLAAASRHWCTA